MIFSIGDSELYETIKKGIGVKKNVSEANRYFEQANESPWDRVTDFDAETTRLTALMCAAPYEEEPREAEAGLDKNMSACDDYELDVADLAKEDLSKYTTNDYLRVYHHTVRHMITASDAMKRGAIIVLYRNLLISYPHLPCFDSDPVFIDVCQTRIKKLEIEENAD